MTKTRIGLLFCFFLVFIIGLVLVSRERTPTLNESALISFATSTPSNLPVLKDRLPPFTGIVKWWNTPNQQAITPEQLQGNVILIDFWTYTGINSIRPQSVLRKWQELYEKDGLTIIGVHTPEFAFEKDAKNVERAIQKAKLTFPVALDSDYGTWEAYGNKHWPTLYLFDRQGRLRYTSIGE